VAGAATSPAPAAAQIPFLSHGVVSKHNVASLPRGPRKGQSPIGWVVVIHGGGWQLVGPAVMASENSTVKFLTGLGWATDNIDYREGEHSLPDVLAAYNALRKRVGTTIPICLLGHSAGGNLALLAAEQRPSVDCVISGAGPTDLVHLASQHAYDPKGLLSAIISPLWTFLNYIVPSFGTNTAVLKQWSPVTDAGAIRVPVLLGSSTHDPLVPQHQMAELRVAMNLDHALGTITTVLLSGTSTPKGQSPNFPHASITKKALASWERDERRLLERVASAA
jgi:acetyl esterase/lipase